MKILGKVKKFANKVLLLALLNNVVMGSAWGGGLTAPFDLESTSVLPKGITNARLRGLWMQMSEAYGGSARVEPIGAKLNKKVSWEDVIKSQDKSLQPIARANVRSICNGEINCSDWNEGPGATTGDLQVNVNVTVPTYVRGITDSTSFILAVPVYNIGVKVGTGYNPSEAYNKWIASFKGDPYQQREIGKKFVDPINTKAADNFYRPIQNKNVQEIGDIKIGGKTAWITDGEDLKYAVKYLLSVPTGQAPDPDEIIDTPTGDGGYALNVIGISEYVVSGNLSVVATLGINYQFEDSIEKRIPLEAGESVSPDKERVSRKRGNQYALGSSFLVGQSTKGLSAGAGYNLQYMEPTKFSGAQYGRTRYSYLGDLYPSQTMHSATALAQYSTIEAYKEKKFVLPMTVSMSYTNVFAGRNVAKSDLISTELLLFF